MSRRCVAYLRVSTPLQTLGSGLVRQLESCIAFARDNSLHIVGVYGDACSGDGRMPNRQLAYLAANQLGCPILVESRDRWSRMAYGDDPLQDAQVVVASQDAREFEERCAKLISSELAIEARRLNRGRND